jgi:hypothetical protein
MYSNGSTTFAGRFIFSQLRGARRDVTFMEPVCMVFTVFSTDSSLVITLYLHTRISLITK